MLLGGLLKAAPSIRAAVKSKPFKKAAKDAMEKTKALYKKAKKSDPERRKNFRARHNCDSPGPKWKARYWSCKMW